MLFDSDAMIACVTSAWIPAGTECLEYVCLAAKDRSTVKLLQRPDHPSAEPRGPLAVLTPRRTCCWKRTTSCRSCRMCTCRLTGVNGPP